MSKIVKTWVMKGPGALELNEFAYPECKKDGAIIKIEAAGACGTDKHLYGGKGGTAKFPIVPGHEMCGIVEELGSNLTDSVFVIGTDKLKEGDRVILGPGTKACGRCYNCLAHPDRPYLCTNRFIYGFSSCETEPHILGGFSQYTYAVNNSFLFKVPDNINANKAVLAEPVTVAVRAVQRAFEPGQPVFGNGLGVGRSVMVIGAGPIGLLIVAVLKYVGAGNIIVTDRLPARLEMAKLMGADVVIDANLSLEERKELVMKNNNGLLPDITFEAAGAPIAFTEAIEFVRRGGIVIESGHYTNTGDASVNPFMICNKDCDIRGCWAVPPIIFRDALNFMSRTTLPIDKIVTHVLPFDKAEEAIKMVGSAEASKVVVNPWQ